MSNIILLRVLCFALLTFAVLMSGFSQSKSRLTKRTKLLTLTSSAFHTKNQIPIKYTCDGANVSPLLKWESLPAKTKSLAIICDDPDAPAGTWIHWILFNIRPSIDLLPEGISKKMIDSLGIKQGMNDFNSLNYEGPCPPKGKPHHYYFKLYALDIILNLNEGSTEKQLLIVMKNHILAEEKLIGIYQRK